MGKVLAGVKYGGMSSQQKPPRNTKGHKKMTGRAGPPMVDIGAKQGRVGTAKAPPSHRFAKVGSVSERNSNSGPSHQPTIGSQRNRSGKVGPFK